MSAEFNVTARQAIAELEMLLGVSCHCDSRSIPTAAAFHRALLMCPIHNPSKLVESVRAALEKEREKEEDADEESFPSSNEEALASMWIGYYGN